MHKDGAWRRGSCGHADGWTGELGARTGQAVLPPEESKAPIQRFKKTVANELVDLAPDCT